MRAGEENCCAWRTSSNWPGATGWQKVAWATRPGANHGPPAWVLTIAGGLLAWLGYVLQVI
jgi:hypothetical protein